MLTFAERNRSLEVDPHKADPVYEHLSCSSSKMSTSDYNIEYCPFTSSQNLWEPHLRPCDKEARYTWGGSLGEGGRRVRPLTAIYQRPVRIRCLHAAIEYKHSAEVADEYLYKEGG